jgi:hypothetical protein
LRVNIHVIDFWLLDEVLVALLGDFFLKHLHFFLIFLHAHINAVSQNVSVDDLGGSQGLGGLLVAEAPLLLAWLLLGARGLQLHIGLGCRLGLRGLGDIVDKLATDAVGAVPVGAVLLAKLRLVKNRNIGLYHHVVFRVGKRALKLDKLGYC